MADSAACATSADAWGTDLRGWDIADVIKTCYVKAGITELFPWQAQCLLDTGALLAGTNLVYSAPTSAGKTLVAELIVLRRSLRSRKSKTLFILPFVSVARQKMTSLQKLYRSARVRVDGFIGSYTAPGGLARCQVAVCTIERANALLNRLIDGEEKGDASLIGTIVIDELHTIADPSRGYLLELLLTKLLYLSRVRRDKEKDSSQGTGEPESRDNSLQVVAMSATVANLPLISDWLCAKAFHTDFRPVPLTEYLTLDGDVIDCANLQKVRTAPKELCIGANESDGILPFCLETVLEGCGVLIFCGSKAQCESLAENIAKCFRKIATQTGELATSLRNAFNPLVIENVQSDLQRVSSDQKLIKLLSCGVAFHHAGLTTEERELIERAFSLGGARVLTATTTLAAGVNLPARRVIVRSTWPSLHVSQYRQMVGESLLMCQNASEMRRAAKLVGGDLPPVTSSLAHVDAQGKPVATDCLKRALLEAVAGRLAETQKELIQFLQGSLFYAEHKEKLGEEKAEKILSDLVGDCIKYYSDAGFVATSDDGSVTATQLGNAAVASSLGPEQTLRVYEDLEKASRGIVLQNELHMIYLVTPLHMHDAWSHFNWQRMHQMWCALPEGHKLVAQTVGLSERFIVLRANNAASCQGKGAQKLERMHTRFYTALALYDLANERPLHKVARDFECSRGFLQSLQQQAATYAGMVVALCDRLGWVHMRNLLHGFAERIAFGVHRELTELVRLDGVDGSRARSLHQAGLKTLAALVRATDDKISDALKKAVPFEGSSTTNTWLCGRPPSTLPDAVSKIKGDALMLLADSLSELGIESPVASAQALELLPAVQRGHIRQLDPADYHTPNRRHEQSNRQRAENCGGESQR